MLPHATTERVDLFLGAGRAEHLTKRITGVSQWRNRCLTSARLSQRQVPPH